VKTFQSRIADSQILMVLNLLPLPVVGGSFVFLLTINSSPMSRTRLIVRIRLEPVDFLIEIRKFSVIVLNVPLHPLLLCSHLEEISASFDYSWLEFFHPLISFSKMLSLSKTFRATLL
jgi:hypothetical protein